MKPNAMVINQTDKCIINCNCSKCYEGEMYDFMWAFGLVPGVN